MIRRDLELMIGCVCNLLNTLSQKRLSMTVYRAPFCSNRFSGSIGRWLVHSSSCPSCRSRVHDDTPSVSPPRSPSATSRTVSSTDAPPQVGRGAAEVGDDVNSSPLDNASRSRVNDGVDDRPLSPIRGEDGPAPFC